MWTTSVATIRQNNGQERAGTSVQHSDFIEIYFRHWIAPEIHRSDYEESPGIWRLWTFWPSLVAYEHLLVLSYNSHRQSYRRSWLKLITPVVSASPSIGRVIMLIQLPVSTQRSSSRAKTNTDTGGGPDPPLIWSYFTASRGNIIQSVHRETKGFRLK